MKLTNLNLEWSASLKHIKRIALIIMALLAVELATIFNADAQRHGGFGHSGFGGHYGYGGHFGDGGHFGFRGRPFFYDPFFPGWGAYYWYFPYSAISFYYGGLDYYYCDGIYYRDFDGRYEMVSAPIGRHVRKLPKGSVEISVNGMPYFYYYGTFYKTSGRKYEVAAAPVGALVESIPSGSEKVEISGQNYYIVNGAQYKPVLRNNEVWYEVIKSNGNSPNPVSPPKQEQKTEGTMN